MLCCELDDKQNLILSFQWLFRFVYLIFTDLNEKMQATAKVFEGLKLTNQKIMAVSRQNRRRTIFDKHTESQQNIKSFYCRTTHISNTMLNYNNYTIHRICLKQICLIW